MVSPKVRRAPTSPAPPRQRGHPLAPEHLGEGGAAAALVVAIGGMSLFIAAVAMTVSGLTFPSRFTGADAPANAGQLGLGQVAGGIGLLVLSILVVGSAVALLAGLRRSRAFAAVMSGVTTLLALAGFAVLLTPTRRDVILLSALGVAVVAFGGASVVLARLRR